MPTDQEIGVPFTSEVYVGELRLVTTDWGKDCIVVDLGTATTEFHPDRTVRLMCHGVALTKRCIALVGRRVKVWVEIYRVASGEAVPVLERIEYLDINAAPTLLDDDDSL